MLIIRQDHCHRSPMWRYWLHIHRPVITVTGDTQDHQTKPRLYYAVPEATQAAHDAKHIRTLDHPPHTNRVRRAWSTLVLTLRGYPI